LRLEPIRADHAAAMFEGLHEPSLYAYQTDEPPADLTSLRERYAQLATGRAPTGEHHWLNWIVVRSDSGDAAGYVQATLAKDGTKAEIGYLILVAHQGRGFAREAVGATVQHLFGARVESVHAVVDARNLASIALLERLGFVRRGTERSEDVIGGVRWFDHQYVLEIPGAEGCR
jgi:ribosomal-protein-alanine N-acetyltransferase